MQNADRVEALKSKIRDLRSRMPVHSVKPSMLLELEELEEQLKDEVRALKENSTRTDT